MDPNIIIAELEDYSRKSGLKPTTICQRALGNARLYERLKRRVDHSIKEAETLRRWMASNQIRPPRAEAS